MRLGRARTDALLLRAGLQLFHRHLRAVVAVRPNFPKHTTAKGGIAIAAASAYTARLTRKCSARAINCVKAGRGDDTLAIHSVRPVLPTWSHTHAHTYHSDRMGEFYGSTSAANHHTDLPLS